MRFVQVETGPCDFALKLDYLFGELVCLLGTVDGLHVIVVVVAIASPRWQRPKRPVVAISILSKEWGPDLMLSGIIFVKEHNQQTPEYVRIDFSNGFLFEIFLRQISSIRYKCPR